MPNLIRRLVAEFIGTFGLVFIGCGVVVTDAIPGLHFGLVGVAAAHALVLSVMITATMNISGGHLNPAVTLGLFSVGRIGALDALAYVLTQLGAAALAAMAVAGLWPPASVKVAGLGAPVLAPAIGLGGGILLEAILTFFLVSAVFGTAVAKDAPKVGGFGIGLVLLFDILAGGPLTGAAMNPARAFGPQVVTQNWLAGVVWWAGPVLGGIVAAQLWERVLLPRSQ